MMLVSYIQVPLQVTAAPLLIQFLTNVPGKANNGSSAWDPTSHVGERPGWSAWLLVSALPTRVCCSHLGHESMDERVLSQSVCLILFISPSPSPSLCCSGFKIDKYFLKEKQKQFLKIQ